MATKPTGEQFLEEVPQSDLPRTVKTTEQKQRCPGDRGETLPEGLPAREARPACRMAGCVCPAGCPRSPSRLSAAVGGLWAVHVLLPP